MSSDAHSADALGVGTQSKLLASGWPTDGSMIDRIDKRVSSPIFKLQLGRSLEWVLSVPGCFFGMPAALLVSPSLIACAVGGCTNASMQSLAVLCSATVAILGVWVNFNRADTSSIKSSPPLLLFRPVSVIVAPALGTALAYFVAEGTVARAAGSFHIATWYAGIIPVLLLKQSTRRRRPVACEPDQISAEAVAAAKAKYLSNIPAKLRHADANASFPSGDVGGAVSVAYVLLQCGGSAAAAVSCVLLSAFGRMYWQAHHALDVLAGAAVSLLTCVAVDAILRASSESEAFGLQRGRLSSPSASSSSSSTSSSTSTCPPALWWHPLLPLVALAVQQKLQKALQKRRREESAKKAK